MEKNNLVLVREKVVINMADNLAMLHTNLGLTQVQLTNLIGVSRHTIMQVENNKVKLSWNTFLSLLLVFIKNTETDKLLNILEIYTAEIISDNDDVYKICAERIDILWQRKMLFLMKTNLFVRL